MKAVHRTWLALGLFVPLALVLIGTFACLPAPVGDPEQSKVDESLAGAYRGVPTDKDDKSSILAILRPWDGHTYMLEYMVVDKTNGKEERQIQHYKAWLTTLSGKTFLTAQPMDDLKVVLGNDGEKPFWVVMRLDKVGTGLEIHVVDESSSFLKGLTKKDELEAAIKAHASDAALYTDSNILFKKLGKEDQAFLDDTLAAFNTKK